VHVEGLWSCLSLMVLSTESELIRQSLPLEGMEELISHVLQHILVLEMVVVQSSELDYQWKI